MSNESQVEAGGLPDNESGGSNQEISKESNASGGSSETVNYLTYKKAVDEKKRLQAALEERDNKLSDYEKSKLESEGKMQELVDSLKQENQQLKSEKTKVFGNFAYQSVTQQLQALGAKAGCVKPDALARLIDIDDFDVDTDTFLADEDQVKTAIEKVKSDMPMLFGKSSPNINTSNPRVDVNAERKTKKLSDLSDDELTKALGASLKRK